MNISCKIFLTAMYCTLCVTVYKRAAFVVTFWVVKCAFTVNQASDFIVDFICLLWAAQPLGFLILL